MWTQEQAIALCRRVEAFAPEYGCHVALTGGLLYKDGPRKDCDLVFYAIREAGEPKRIDVDGLFRALVAIGIERKTERERFVIKAMHAHGAIDCLFPEFDADGVYAEEAAAESARINRLLDADIAALRAAAEECP